MALPENSKALFNQNGVLVDINNTPVRDFGFTWMDMLESATVSEGISFYTDGVNITLPWTPTHAMEQLDLYAAEGWRQLRARPFPGMWPKKFTDNWGPIEDYGTAGYWASVDAKWDIMEQLLDHAASLGIGVTFDLFGTPQTMADYMQQPISTWGDPNSVLFQRTAEIATRFITRFKDHPAIAIWEVSSEYDTAIYHDHVPNSPGPNTQGWKESYTYPEDMMNYDQFSAFNEHMSAVFRAADDTGRVISSGVQGMSAHSRLDLFKPWWENWHLHCDAFSIHHYQEHDAGNTDYSSFYDHLVLLRKIAKSHNKPFVIGEHGTGADRDWGSLNWEQLVRKEYDALIASGTQLSWHWQWRKGRDSATGKKMDIHPDTDTPSIKLYYQLLKEYRDKMRAEPEQYLDPDTLPVSEFTYQPAFNQIVADGNTKVLLENTIENHGFGIACWVRFNTNRQYGQNIIWSITDKDVANPVLGSDYLPKGIASMTLRLNVRNLILAVEFHDGTSHTVSLGQLDFDDPWILEADNPDRNRWFHLAVQFAQPYEAWTAEDYPDPVPIIRTYLNGERKNRIEIPYSTTSYFRAPTGNLTLFGFEDEFYHNASVFVEKLDGGIAGLTTFNRFLQDGEIYNFYLTDKAPEGSVSGRWDFVAGSLVNSVTGTDGSVSAGTLTTDTFTLPASAHLIDYVYNPVIETTDGATLQLRRMSSSELKTFVGGQGELVVNTDLNEITVHDGVTAGGHRLHKQKRQTTKARSANTDRYLHAQGEMLVDSSRRPIREMGVTVSTAGDYISGLQTAQAVMADIESASSCGIKTINIDGFPGKTPAQAACLFVDKTAYHKRIINLLDYAYDKGVGLIINLPNSPEAILIAYNRSQGFVTNNAISSASAVFLTDLADHRTTASSVIDEAITDFMTVIGDHPAVSGFTLLNDVNKLVAEGSTPSTDTSSLYLTSYGSTGQWVYTRELLQILQARYAGLITSLDTVNRVILPGHDSPGYTGAINHLAEVKHNMAQVTTITDGLDWHCDSNDLWANRAGTNLKDMFIEGRKMAKDIINGPFVVSELSAGHLVNAGSYMGKNSYRERIAAVFDSGTQLACWSSWGNNNDSAGNFIHDENTNGTADVVNFLIETNERMRVADYLPVDAVHRTRVSNRTTASATVNTDTSVVLSSSQATALDNPYGMAVSFWFKNDSPPFTGEKYLMSKTTSGGGGWYISLLPDRTIKFVTQWYDGANFTPVSTTVRPASGWNHLYFHVDKRVLQDNDYTSTAPRWLHDVPYISAHVNGMYVGSNYKPTGSLTYSANSAADLKFFVSPYGASDYATNVSIKDVVFYDRPLRDGEVRDLYLFDRKMITYPNDVWNYPEPKTNQRMSHVAAWEFKNGNFVDSIHGLTPQVTKGNVEYNSGFFITKPRRM